MARSERPDWRVQHDPEEARDLLARYAEETSPDPVGRRKAAENLLKDLVRLSRLTKVSFRRDEMEGGVWVSIDRRSVKVKTDDAGRVLVAIRDSVQKPKEVPLTFNPVTRKLESPKEDTFHTPEPGRPVRRRSALAEVVEAALALLKTQLPQP